MKFRSLLWNYIVDLIENWISKVFVVGDVIWVLSIFIGNLKFQIWFYFLVFGLEFIIANYIVYHRNRIAYMDLEVAAQKEIEELKARILELEDRIPKLGLFFKVGDDYIERQTIIVKQKPVAPDFDKLVEEERTRVVSAYDSKKPNLDKFSTDPTRKLNEIARLMTEMPKDRKDYEKECRDYIEEYRSYLYSKYNYEVGQYCYRSVQFAVKNNGRTPANEIVLLLYFPNGFYFFGGEYDEAESRQLHDFTYPPDKPTPPTVTQSVSDLLKKSMSFDSIISPPMFNAGITPKAVGGPYIRKIKSTEIEYDIDELLHNFTQDDLDELYFVVEEEVIGRTVEISYEIHASNLPIPTKGSLWIEIIQES